MARSEAAAAHVVVDFLLEVATDNPFLSADMSGVADARVHVCVCVCVCAPSLQAHMHARDSHARTRPVKGAAAVENRGGP